jgi:hypothetical protein
MSVEPKHYRAAHLALPRLPLPAILGFAAAALGGVLFLAHSGFSSAEAGHSLVPLADDVPVYEARAVPMDPPPENILERAVSISRALTATRSEAPQSGTSEEGGIAEPLGPTLLADATETLRGFNHFSNSSVGNNYLTLTGVTFGMSAQMAPSGFAAPDAETETVISSPVPEASTWLCGAALLALVAVRGVHASWHRKRRRDQ